MSLVSEIVVREGNEDLNVDGWRVCSFQDEDVNGNQFTNFEVAYWRNGGVEWASLNEVGFILSFVVVLIFGFIPLII